MLRNVADDGGRNERHRPVDIVFIGGDEPTLERVVQSIRLRWPLATTISAATGAAGLELVREASPDLVIIHSDLRDMFPQVLVEELRGISRVPILVLTRETDETESITALELGADDYVQFPCGIWQFIARVWAILRRSGFISFRDEKRCLLINGRLSIDPHGHEVYLDGERIYLTPTEFQLLYLLARNHGEVVSHQVLENALWSNRESGFPSAKKPIQRLRWNLEDSAINPHWIARVYGLGYRLVELRLRWREPFHSN